MKIRKGFVSNSSSSSFIVDSQYHETTFDLAKEMLEIRNEDYQEYEADRKQYTPEIDNINKAIQDGRDPNQAISFNSCNYRTYIKKIGNYYLVMTSNNHPFENDVAGVFAAAQKK